MGCQAVATSASLTAKFSRSVRRDGLVLLLQRIVLTDEMVDRFPLYGHERV
jgi:hypothetical protein